MMYIINSSPPGKMAAISQTIFSNAFSWLKSFVFRLKISWSYFARVQIDNNPSIGLDNGAE